MGSEISWAVAFAAGLASFLSPCVLPLIPVYVTYLTGGVGSDTKEKGLNWQLFLNALWFIFGFSAIFILLGASATYIGRLFLINQALFRKVAGVVIILFGLQTMGVFRIGLLQKEWRPGLSKMGAKKGTQALRSLALGLAFGFGWTPCVGPVLGAILLYAGTSGTVASGIWLLTWYSLGLAVPFMAIALTLDRFGPRYLPFLQRNSTTIKIITGLLLVVLGIVVYSNLFLKLSGLSF